MLGSYQVTLVDSVKVFYSLDFLPSCSINIESGGSEAKVFSKLKGSALPKG